MWIWLLAVLIVAFAWVARLVFGWIPEWLAVVLTLVGILLIIGRLVGSKLRARLRARALERDLLKQAEQQALNARPDRRAEIADLQSQMQRGLQAMRQSPGGSAALYTLPWYMIIGPPGAGKTTALRQSGLAFPFTDPRSGGGVRGVGGTRNCDWWFTNDAILLDTAGRYATEADDYDEWTSFLDTLKKYRPRKPINGVLVAISVTELMDANEDKIDSIAKRLRARIDEVTTRLHMLVPVYVMFTKVDLVAGFVEMWGDLRKSERGQIWGVTFPLAGAERREPGMAFDPEMDALVERVHARAIRRVGKEREVQWRPRIVQFPLEFAALKMNLVGFLGSLLHPNNFRETPVLRGVYFTSGTQEGTPIDRVIGGMMQAFNLPPAGHAGPPGAGAAGPMGQTESKSYFVTDLFRRVVFADQHVAGRTQAEAKRQLANRILFAAASLVVAIGLVVPSTFTFARNMFLVSEDKALAEKARRIDWSDGNTPLAKVHALDDLRGEVARLDAWHDQGVPLGMGWGMYAGDKLSEPLRGVYAQSLRTGFVQPTKAQLERELAPAAAQSHLSIDQYAGYFARLKAYLSLADPQRLQGDDADLETTALTEAWARSLGVTGAPDRETLKPHVAEYVRFVARGQVPPWAVDTSLVTRVRAVLSQTSEVDRDYSTLIREANDQVAPITRALVLRGTSFSQFVTSRTNPEVVVHGAFTRTGWENFLRDSLDERRAKRLVQDRWVLGESDQRGAQEIQRELGQLQQRYFSEYIAAWAGLLKDLQIKKPESDDEALRELSSLSETPWPDLLLLETVSENTRLQLSPDSPLASAGNRLLGGAASAAANSPLVKLLPDASVPQAPKRWVSAVEQAFNPMTTFGIPIDPLATNAPTELTHYLENIVSKLVAVLTDLKDSPIKPTAHVVASAYQTAERATNELLDSTQTQFTRPLLAPLLLVPLVK
jgi:type VI secretion system protein ImpL